MSSSFVRIICHLLYIPNNKTAGYDGYENVKKSRFCFLSVNHAFYIYRARHVVNLLFSEISLTLKLLADTTRSLRHRVACACTDAHQITVCTNTENSHDMHTGFHQSQRRYIIIRKLKTKNSIKEKLTWTCDQAFARINRQLSPQFSCKMRICFGKCYRKGAREKIYNIRSTLDIYIRYIR